MRDDRTVKYVRVSPDDLTVGRSVPWTVYDVNRRLLMKQGDVIANARQLSILLERGLYREIPRITEPTLAELLGDEANIFSAMETLSRFLHGIFGDILAKRSRFPDKLDELVFYIHKFCQVDPDQTLGAIHLQNETPYTIWHPLHVALLSDLIGTHLNYSPEARQSLLKAALTANIGMLELQDTLYKQGRELTPDQSQAVHAHCAQSVGLLRAAGVTDTLWLDTVMQHHEKLNGGGYPQGLHGDQILQEARIIALSDRYSAMVSPRGYRKGLPTHKALRDVFLQKGEEYDELLAVAVIKELGIYPPGTFVKLANGEIAIVAKRGKDGRQPVVCSVFTAQGDPFQRPVRRDCSQPIFKITDNSLSPKPIPVPYHQIWQTAF